MNFFRNLQRRERLLVVGAGALLVLFLMFKRSADLDRQLVTARRQLGELRTMQQDYQRQKSGVARINSQLKNQPNFAIFSHLEELAGQTGIRNKIVHMKPTVSAPNDVYNEESVEVKMEGVTLAQLVQYLHQVENSPQLLKIKRLEMKPRFDNRQILTAIFRVSAFTLKEGSS